MVEFHDQLQHLPRIWSDAAVFGVGMRDNVLDKFLEILAHNHREDLKEAFATVALDVKKRIDSQPVDRSNRVLWSGPVMSHVCVLLVRNGQIEPAWEVISNYWDKTTQTLGFPSQEALTELVDAQVPIAWQGLAKFSGRIKQCLTLAADLGFVELVDRAEELAVKLNLPPKEVQQWRRIGGSSVGAMLREEETRASKSVE